MAALLALDVWLPKLRGRTLCLFQMDATAALFTILKSSGKTPVMNAMAAEIALRLECADVQTLPEHLSGTLNFQCDALSRLSQGAPIPDVLVNLPRETPKERSEQFFWAWPRTMGTRTEKVALSACGPGDSVRGVGPSSQPSARPGVQLLSRAKATAKRARKAEVDPKDVDADTDIQFQ